MTADLKEDAPAVKGGKFAKHCEPAHMETIILSDIIGNPLDMIASGPAYPDSSSCEQALRIVDKYGLELSESARRLLEEETPKELASVASTVIGNVKELCRAAMHECESLGYELVLLTDCLNVEARAAGAMLGNIARSHSMVNKKLAFIAGGYVDGETLSDAAAKGLSIEKSLQENDSYTLLKVLGGLIITGPTGTNVNDVAVVLIDGE